jgi:SecD/SecF fusion protein
MRYLYRHVILILAVVLLLTAATIPPDKKLRRGKDLAGGATLVYQVDIRPTDRPGTIDKVKDLIKNRIDPNNLLEIDIVTQGTNRIELSMPLPSPRVQQLRRTFEDKLAQLGQGQLREEQLGQILSQPKDQRTAELARLSAGDPQRQALFDQAATTFDAWQTARTQEQAARAPLAAAADEARNAVATARASGMAPEALKVLEDAQRRAEDAVFDSAAPVAKAELAYEAARTAALKSLLSGAELRRVLELSDRRRRLPGEQGKIVELPSPREVAMERLLATHPGATGVINASTDAWNQYQSQRQTLDDPADVKRLLRSAGVLDFRITVSNNELASDLPRLRAELRQSGPRAVRATNVRWYKLNKLDGWMRSVNDYTALAEAEKASTARGGGPGPGVAEFFASKGYVIDTFDGEYYMLCYDEPGRRLTQAEGAWGVAGANTTIDELGKPAIAFNMDPLGASKLGDLTSANVGRQMAVLLDDQVYTAPVLQSRITSSGRITGEFTQSEIDYVVRVLAAGSMAAKLSPEPVSESTIGPELGADNLQRGIKAGIVAFALVGAIMVVYYFGCGLVAVFALFLNGLLILGLMALNHAAFSLPGIAGVVLTFGMAVDANVLIYERMREEIQQGADFRNAVRLGYARALPSIVDGNMTVLIVCVVLAFTGTQEIKGFAITMIIGSLTTFFTQLYVTRVLFYVLVERLGWRNGTMLAVKVPAIARALHWKVDWMKYRHVMLGLSALLVVAGLTVVFTRGEKVWDNDFRGGTKVTVALKDGPGGRPMSLTRADALQRVQDVSQRPEFADISEFKAAELLAVNPDPDDSTRSSRFTIKTTETDGNRVQQAVLLAFKDVIDEQPPIRFAGSDNPLAQSAPIKPITERTLGDNIERPAIRTSVSEFVGGAAIVLDDLQPRPSLQQLEERLRAMRNDPVHQAAAARFHQFVILAGDERQVQSAVLLVRDETASFLQDPARWAAALKASEWRLVTDALSRSSSLAGVESFSPSIARAFVAQAIIAVLLSGLLIGIYIWLRFQSFRYSFGAICSTLHDCVVATGALAACGMAVTYLPGVSAAIGIEPFKIDLNVVAAVLTILGYSLNDTVIVMDRIRETKGKAEYATRQIVNDAVNSTLSRTVLTAGLTAVATLVLYLIGGEAIRPFAFTFLVGVATGTYSSIFIAAPLCYVRAKDQSLALPAAARPAM